MMNFFMGPHKKLLWPLLIFLGLVVFLYSQLNNPKTIKAHTQLNQMFPEFTRPNTLDATQNITLDQILGEPALINIWSTWCPQSQLEHLTLMKLFNQSIKIYGIPYKSDPVLVQEWLEKQGNPYQKVIHDEGELALNLGVTGTPETFLIDSNGRIVLHYSGLFTEAVWNEHFKPIYQKCLSPSKTKQ